MNTTYDNYYAKVLEAFVPVSSQGGVDLNKIRQDASDPYTPSSLEYKLNKAKAYLRENLPTYAYFIQNDFRMMVHPSVRHIKQPPYPNSPIIAINETRTILYNPKYIVEYSIAEVASMLFHEAMHCTRGDLEILRDGRITPHDLKILNIVSDLLINDDIQQTSVLPVLYRKSEQVKTGSYGEKINMDEKLSESQLGLFPDKNGIFDLEKSGLQGQGKLSIRDEYGRKSRDRLYIEIKQNWDDDIIDALSKMQQDSHELPPQPDGQPTPPPQGTDNMPRVGDIVYKKSLDPSKRKYGIVTGVVVNPVDAKLSTVVVEPISKDEALKILNKNKSLSLRETWFNNKPLNIFKNFFEL